VKSATHTANFAGRLPLVTSRQLAAALAVAECRNFLAAAVQLGISQPALTLAIKRLEQTLGVSLFLRSTRQVTVSAAGREFVAMAQRMLNDLKLGLQSLQELSQRQRGQVIVTSLISLTMSGVIAEYGREYPGIEIQLREGFQDDIREDVRSGLADFGIGNLDDLPESFQTESIGVQELCVFVREDHPLARGRQIEFNSLKDIPLVSFRAGSTIRRLLDATALNAGFALHHAVTVSSPLTLLNLVASGRGVAVGPARPWPRPAFPGLVSRALVRPRLASEIGIMRLRERDLSPAASGLLALARERLRTGRAR
jgi:DNA-binding transcriptional LysR family regulator